jgi:hypothetical protein
MAQGAAKSSPAAVRGADQDGEMHSQMMEQVDEAQKDGDFVTAKALLSRLRKKMKDAARKAAEEAAAKGIEDATERPEDPYLIQRLAFVTYKSKHPTPQKALEDARELLLTLDPATSNDPETLGLWGAIHKRLWDETQDRPHLDEAVRGYERGFYLRNDFYNGINLAFLLNVRAAHASSRAEAVADFVQAGRVRREVASICEAALAGGGPADPGTKYWVLATLAEARLGADDEAGAKRALQEASDTAPAPWMKESTEEQLDKLRRMLADSPLRYVNDGAA